MLWSGKKTYAVERRKQTAGLYMPDMMREIGSQSKAKCKGK